MMKQAVSAALCALAWNITTANAQNTVVVQSGESLSEQDLINGTFMGQDFDLAPDTIFQILNGGLIGPIGSSSEVSPFSFGGSSVNLEAGSNFTPIFDITKSYLSDITLNAYENSTIWDASLVGLAAQVNLHGGFYVGSLYDGATLNMDSGALIAGTKAYRGSTINTTGGLIQFTGIYEKSTINAMNTEILNSFGVYSGSVANLVNSTIGHDGRVQQSTLNMTGGSIAEGMLIQASAISLESVFVETDLEIRGGSLSIVNSSIGDNFASASDTEINLHSGSIGDNARVTQFFGLGPGGTLNQYGGSIGNNLLLSHSSTLNVWGGQLGESFKALSGANVNLFVEEVYIDGVEIELALNQQIHILERDGALLEAVLSDGTFFDLNLNDDFVLGEDQLTDNVLLTVTRIPTPGSHLILSAAVGLYSRRQKRP